MTTIQDSRALTEARNVRDATGLEIAILQHKRTQWECRLVSTWGAGDRPEWDHGICKGCGCAVDDQPTTVSIAETSLTLRATCCEPCMDLVRVHYGTERGDVNESETPKWDQHCPPRLRQAIEQRMRPPGANMEAIERVAAWRPDQPKGLAIMGNEGSGKSLALWTLYRELERAQMNPFAISGVELGRQLSKAARDINDVRWLARARVLLVDDFGKERATPAVGALLWEVLDERYNHNLPLIFTTRFTGDELTERFGEKYLGDDIRRRLNAICRAVNFTTMPKQ